MNDLRKKVFTLLIVILSAFLLCLTIIFNISIYNKEKNDIKNKFIMLETAREKFYFKDSDVNTNFMENEAYEVVINKYGEVEKIFSYTPDGLSNSEIVNLINKNINKIDSSKIRSLYLNDYLFILNKNGNLLILNNTNSRNYLLKELIRSIIIFIILEISVILSSMKITKWIVKPVNDAFEKQKQFIYDASHELKTPISIIGASAETLERSPNETKWLMNIKNENERMSKLVTSLLDLSKTEKISENESFSNVDLSKLIYNKALSFESLMFDNNLELELDIDKNISFNCNADRMRELLSILMDNAIKHSFNDSKIVVLLKKEKNNIILSVKNNGEEIPFSEREKIFERFYRIDKSRNRDENRYGLGLSIAKNIVLNHNGSIKVNCSSGYTTFIVIFKQN